MSPYVPRVCSSRMGVKEEDSGGKDGEDLAEENARLRLLISDITEVNKRWQRYHQKHEDRVQRLAGEVVELRARLTDKPPLRPARSLPADSLQERYARVVRENGRLEAEVRSLRRHQGSPDSLTALEHQVQLHKEDWEAERLEKQQVQQKLLQVESELETCKFKCQLYEKQLSDFKAAALSAQKLTPHLRRADTFPKHHADDFRSPDPSAPEASTAFYLSCGGTS